MGKIRIISNSGEMFNDRQEAGRLLAVELMEYRGQNTTVLGIPRGGMVVAAELARNLDTELDIVISRKLRAPGYPELAMGSVAESGKTFLNDSVIQDVKVSKAAMEREKEVQLEEIKRRSALVRKIQPRMLLTGRIAIVTDDGVATGATTQAALWAVRQEKPDKLIAAVPVGSEQAIRRLADEVDEMVCLRTPPFFFAVGQFYRNFPQVEDEEVLNILKENKRRNAVPS
jgi:putative phosphoribosyl transferase